MRGRSEPVAGLGGQPPATFAPTRRISRVAARWERVARNSHTVADWKRLRSDRLFAGFEVDALRVDRRVTHGKMSLERLRAEHVRG
jgi:hypothetical protein